MSTSDERGRIAADHQLNQERLVELAQVLKSKSYSTSAIAHILRLSESTVRTMVDENKINWGFNCLTSGIHHGRPEAIWNVPLLHAIHIYHREMLHDLVIARIHSDALEFVNRDKEFIQQGARETVSYSEEWAKRVETIAREKYGRTLQHTVGELSNYYKSSTFERDSDDAVRQFAEGKLNPGYKPLHGHDSINMLCRILGTKASRAATS